MRRCAWIPIAFLAACAGFAGQASAAVKVTESVQQYRISGKSGEALLKAMDRRGPKHGFLTRAIAQTSYSVAWTIEWAETAKACRVKRVDGELVVLYTLPRPTGDLPPDLKRRWRKFYAGVKKHEKVHGDLARRMARAAEKAIASVTIANDKGCRKSSIEAKRRMSAIYADYEARQNRFDEKEHRDGGRVERLIDALVQRGGV